jgi:hypothetical protein
VRRFYYLANHQDKAKPFSEALGERGWVPERRPRRGLFMLMDADAMAYQRRIDKMWTERRIPSFVYPHAGPPSLLGDYEGYAPSRNVRARFVVASGHVDVMRSYGYSGTIIVAGWSWCPIRPFRSRKHNIGRVLLMPIHPNSNLFLSERDKVLNAAAFERACKIAETFEAHLVVRHIHSLEANGLQPTGRASYIQGHPHISESFMEINKADLVIAHHTPAYMAVAWGVPTLMIGEYETPFIGGKESDLHYARNWKGYADLMAYPLDILGREDYVYTANEAVSSDAKIADWRERMIGSYFDPKAFVDNMESNL